MELSYDMVIEKMCMTPGRKEHVLGIMQHFMQQPWCLRTFWGASGVGECRVSGSYDNREW